MSMWLLGKVLTRLVRKGTLTVTDHRGTIHRFGEADPAFPDIAIRLTDGRVPLDLVKSPELGAAETFMDGRMVIDRDDILGFITLIQQNNPWERDRHIDPPGGLRHRIGRLTKPLIPTNLPGRSRQNVAHHYDLDGRLYELFLDADRQYSCAYYARPDMTLEEAQEAKKAHIAAKLALAPGQHVLEIGCGWGGMALYLHRHFGVEVTGITLSTEQLAYARERAAEAGVSDKVHFELIDYRAVTGRFDRIVSIGMFEHVGQAHFAEFFRTCHNLLTPDGVMLLHTIGRSDGPNVTDAFTRKYIFPGGYIPAMSEVLAAIEPHNLMVTDIEILRLHYARTLREWYARTVANRTAIEALYDARFFRMWTFYLAGAICAFEYRALVNFQLQIVR
ncbi:MAG: cyclopropane-fatty-acyl-phospholipid synthase family protein, partial [Sphingobium sp.]